MIKYTIRAKQLKDQIKQDLRAAFPATRFEVRGHNTARRGGRCHIDITWHDGPTHDAVASFTKIYQDGEGGEVLMKLNRAVEADA